MRKVTTLSVKKDVDPPNTKFELFYKKKSVDERVNGVYL